MPKNGYNKWLTPYNVRKAIATGKQAYRSYQTVKRYFKSPTQNTVTSQYDTKQQYRRKRMPRRKRKQWKSFSRKVNSVITKSLGTKTRLFNSTTEINIDAADTGQNYCSAFLYSKSGFATTIKQAGIKDIYECIKGISADDNFTVRFETGILDLTCRNTSSTVGADLEIDLYVVTMNKKVNYNGNNLEEMIVAAEQETSTLPNPITGLTLANRGATLFDLPCLMKLSGMKILSKRKYFLPKGNTFTYQYRDPSNHYIPAMQIREGLTNAQIDTLGSGFVYPKLTKGIILVAKKIVGSTGLQAQLQVGVTRKYKYSQLESSAIQDAWNSNQ